MLIKQSTSRAKESTGDDPGPYQAIDDQAGFSATSQDFKDNNHKYQGQEIDTCIPVHTYINNNKSYVKNMILILRSTSYRGHGCILHIVPL